MKNLIILIILTLNVLLVNAKSSFAKNDSLQDKCKSIEYDSIVRINTVNLNTSNNRQIHSHTINDNIDSQKRNQLDESEAFTLVINDLSSQDGLITCLKTIINTFNTGFSIWNSEPNNCALRHCTSFENEYRVKLSIGTTNHGAGLKFTF